MKNHELLILGGNHQNPLGVIEALGQRGLYSNVIINTNAHKSFVLKSKYIKRGWICKTSNEIIECIQSNFSHLSSKVITYACSDDMASLLNDNYDMLKEFLCIPGINQQGKLTELMHKDIMTTLASELGLNIPKSWIVKDKQIPKDINYPCVTKSLTSVHHGKSEFTLCHNKEELEQFLTNNSYSSSIQVQEYIDKEFEFQYLGLSLNCGETIIIPGRTHISSTTHFNNLTFLRYQEEKVVKDPSTLILAEQFVKKTRYSGLFSIEFMHGKDGKDYFLEMNFRNDGNGAVVTAAGTNLPYIWYLYNIGENIQNELANSTVKETYSVPEDSYFMSMLEGNVSFRQWRMDMKKATCYITYFKGDTKPFWALMWLQKRAILASVVKKFFHTNAKK